MTHSTVSNSILPTDRTYQIGEVAELTGLSLRTIRHYEEVGVVLPSGRTAGGFRLYTAADIDRLMVAKHLKPLKFSLDDTREIIEALDTVREGEGELASEARSRLRHFATGAAERCHKLRTQLEAAEALTVVLRRTADGDRPD